MGTKEECVVWWALVMPEGAEGNVVGLRDGDPLSGLGLFPVNF